VILNGRGMIVNIDRECERNKNQVGDDSVELKRELNGCRILFVRS